LFPIKNEPNALPLWTAKVPLFVPPLSSSLPCSAAAVSFALLQQNDQPFFYFFKGR
jgi:hypothetical protein